MRLSWSSLLVLGALVGAGATDDEREVKNVAIIGEFRHVRGFVLMKESTLLG